ncbi:MAG: hypothetical protein H0T73_03060, partial [Ardenticatenales bacterium]|nr:hypothetical protein [Ardenticatenales bacterium]
MEQPCQGKFDFGIASAAENEKARFYVYGKPTDDKTLEERLVCDQHPYKSATSEFSYHRYDAYCGELGSHEAYIEIAPGDSLTLTWPLWLQPSEAYDLRFDAVWWVESASVTPKDRYIIGVPQAQITPIVFLPGLGATIPPSYDQIPFGSWKENISQELINKYATNYNVFFDTLEKMGYEGDRTLFFFRYNWLRSARVGADKLWELRLNPQSETVAQVAQIPWVSGYGNPYAVEFDLIGHSTGNLLARAYMQLPYKSRFERQEIWRTNVRRYIGVGGPQMGLVNGYTGLEGQQIFLEPPLGDLPKWTGRAAGLVEGFTVSLAAHHGYCLKQGNRCPVGAEDSYAFAHDPINGASIIAEFLPTATFGNYLIGQEAPHTPFPYGRPANPLLEEASVVNGTSVIDPYLHNPYLTSYLEEKSREQPAFFNWQQTGFNTPYYGLNSKESLQEWSDTLGGLSENVCFVYNTDHDTKLGIRVVDPKRQSWLGIVYEKATPPYWLNGKYTTFKDENDEEQKFIEGDGDELIATISANPTALTWPAGDAPVAVEIQQTNHGQLVGVEESIQSTTYFLTNFKTPFLIGPNVEEFSGGCGLVRSARTEDSNVESAAAPPLFRTQSTQIETQPTRALLVSSRGPVEFLLVGPDGRRVGYDMTTTT